MKRRRDGREPGELRPLSLRTGYLRHAEGSCLIQLGETRVLCAATVSEGVPSWRRGTGEGWLTAEYAMLPRAGLERVPRGDHRGGRATEIRRMIGRALRAALDLQALGETTIVVDCDVIEADGGTRTAAITGSMVAVHQATRFLEQRGVVRRSPIRSLVAAVSVGIVEGQPVLDLPYEEDARADVDMNVVMTDGGHFVEVQGAAEGAPFSAEELSACIDLARSGISQLIEAQRRAIAGIHP